MSYITLMINDSGAVAAADTRESFYHLAHFDWLRKAYLIEGRKLVCCLCGPSFRHGVPIFKTAAAILRANHGSMEAQLERIGRLVSAATALRLPKEDPGPFVLLAAEWNGSGFDVYHFSVVHGKSKLVHTKTQPGKPVSLHAGAWHREMPRLSPDSLRDLSTDQLIDTARQRVELAIEMDAERRKRNPKHNQTIGGRVMTCAVRIKKT